MCQTKARDAGELGVFTTRREHPPPAFAPVTLDDSDSDSSSDGGVDMELNSLSSDNSTGWMDEFLEVDLWSVPYVEPVSFDELFAFTNSIMQQNDAEDEQPDIEECPVDIIDLTVDEDED